MAGAIAVVLAWGVAGVVSAMPRSGPSVAGPPIPAGYDLFETDPAQTMMTFQSPDTGIPAGFFGPGSDPFQGRVKFGGAPLEMFMGHDAGDADTVVQRMNSATPNPDATIPIELVALSLQSIEPIMVTYHGGQQSELWNVDAAPSTSMPSVGQMTIHQPDPNRPGGTFDSQLMVVPLLTFTRLSDRSQRTIDGAGLSPQAMSRLIISQTGAPWRAGCVLPALAVTGLNDGFCAGQTQDGRKRRTVHHGQLLTHGVYPVQPALEHFKCYGLQPKDFVPRQVQLTDQFGTRKANITARADLCNPVQKNQEPFRNRAAHLQCYRTGGPDRQVAVVVRNQFGSQRLLVHRPNQLCLPTQKRLVGQVFQPIQVPIDHYQCYRVEPTSPLQTPTPPGAIRLSDQFGVETVKLGRPYLLCAPVEKVLAGHTTPIQHPVRHLVCYRIRDAAVVRSVDIRNQFERTRLETTGPVGLCVPSDKVVIN